MPIFLESTATSIPYNPGEIWADLGFTVDPGDMCTESFQLGHNILVAAVQVIDVVEDRRPLGAEGCHDEGGAGTDIGDVDRAAVECVGTGDDRGAALYTNVRPQLAELGHVLKAVFEDGLRDVALAVRLRHQADERRLQVRRKAGVRPGRHVDGLQPFTAPHKEAMCLLVHFDARPTQLEDQGAQVSGYSIFQDSLTTRGGDRDGIGPGFDVVGDHPMGRAAQLGHALDLQDVGADALNAGAHLPEEECQVDHVWLAGGVVDRCDAVCGGGRHYQVLRAGHGRHVQVDGGAGQPVGASDVLAVFELDACSHQAEADDVLFHAPHPDVVAAGFGHPGLTAVGQQRPHQ